MVSYQYIVTPIYSWVLMSSIFNCYSFAWNPKHPRSCPSVSPSVRWGQSLCLANVLKSNDQRESIGILVGGQAGQSAFSKDSLWRLNTSWYQWRKEFYLSTHAFIPNLTYTYATTLTLNNTYTQPHKLSTIVKNLHPQSHNTLCNILIHMVIM